LTHVGRLSAGLPVLAGYLFSREQLGLMPHFLAGAQFTYPVSRTPTR
jgi:hypothetical protein